MKQRVKLLLDRGFLLAGLLAMTGLILDFGFQLSATTEAIWVRLDLAILLFFVIQAPLQLLLAEDKTLHLRRFWFQQLLALVIAAEMIWIFQSFDSEWRYFLDPSVTALTQITIIINQVLIFLAVMTQALQLNRKIAALRFHPAQTLLLSFAFVILVGALCLMMPNCRAPGTELNFVDALFTATSATCVTGLTVVDTGSFFTLKGQLVILGLIQVGGLGIMTISSFFALFFAGGVGVRERVLLLDMLNVDRLGAIVATLRQVIGLTFLVEAIGAFFLAIAWSNRGWPAGQQLFYAVFHSVSAFCNAGFALFSDSLVTESASPLLLITISLLIIAGGLGFGVMAEVLRFLTTWRKSGMARQRMGVHSRLVLIVTAALLAIGTLFFWLFEPLSGDTAYGVLQSFFLSVTSRTAGFNNLDIGKMAMSTTFCLLILMFIGASPNSTGGGLKTSTVAVLCGSMWATMTGRQTIVMFKKTISPLVTNRALVIFAFTVCMLTLFVLLLSLSDPEKAPIDLIFEAVSAFSTTGLSRGITAQLSPFGKLVIITAMFIGRIGPLTLALAITAPKGGERINYPSAQVLVG